jgi:hypothetical protein
VEEGSLACRVGDPEKGDRLNTSCKEEKVALLHGSFDPWKLELGFRSSTAEQSRAVGR